MSSWMVVCLSSCDWRYSTSLMPLGNHLACLSSFVSVVKFLHLKKLQWCLFPHSEVETAKLMINSISGMDTYSLFYIVLEVHSFYRNSCMCHFLIWISPERGSCILCQIHLIQFWHVGGPHSEADCSRLRFLQVHYMCFSKRFVHLHSICTNFTNCCYFVLAFFICFDYSFTALFG